MLLYMLLGLSASLSIIDRGGSNGTDHSDSSHAPEENSSPVRKIVFASTIVMPVILSFVPCSAEKEGLQIATVQILAGALLIVIGVVMAKQINLPLSRLRQIIDQDRYLADIVRAYRENS